MPELTSGVRPGRRLFNGRDLDRWAHVGNRTQRPEDNSGVYVRIDGEPPDPWHAVHRGYEVQILASGDEWHRSGVIYTMSQTDRSAERPPGEWNTMEIALSGLRIAVWLNGEQTADFHPRDAPPRQQPQDPERGPRPVRGYIGLKNHDADSLVEFREVLVTPLRPGPDPLSPLRA